MRSDLKSFRVPAKHPSDISRLWMGAITNKTHATVHHCYFYPGEQNKLPGGNQQLEKGVGVQSPGSCPKQPLVLHQILFWEPHPFYCRGTLITISFISKALHGLFPAPFPAIRAHCSMAAWTKYTWSLLLIIAILSLADRAFLQSPTRAIWCFSVHSSLNNSLVPEGTSALHVFPSRQVRFGITCLIWRHFCLHFGVLLSTAPFSVFVWKISGQCVEVQSLWTGRGKKMICEKGWEVWRSKRRKIKGMLGTVLCGEPVCSHPIVYSFPGSNQTCCRASRRLHKQVSLSPLKGSILPTQWPCFCCSHGDWGGQWSQPLLSLLMLNSCWVQHQTIEEE